MMNNMKKLQFVLCVGLAGCEQSQQYHQRMTDGTSVVIIDSCQYIAFTTYSGNVGYTHKGNCNNPIHTNP